MPDQGRSTLTRLVAAVLGEARSRAALEALAIAPELWADTGEEASRAVLAMALDIVLFDDLLARVPSGAAYVARRRGEGGRVVFDHGALRTIRLSGGPTGALPGGIDAFSRLLEPLGYRRADTYPLPALRMTGYAFVHVDHPETIPQFFVSELHVEAFDAEGRAAAQRVFGAAQDPLDATTLRFLGHLAATGRAPVTDAIAILPHMAAAFGRSHPPCSVEDYETLRARSAEAAWIATEGAAFNHVTDRVADVGALAAALRDEGYAMKPSVEVSASGRVRQTALRADTVRRTFASADGAIEREVPGSFYEFITREIDPETGRLDLAFDSGNATGIFAMTKAS